MPPQGPDVDAIPPGQLLPLADWLKLLSSRGVDMRVAMALAAKIYKSHNTKERLAELDNKKLVTLVTDKDQRKSVVNALKGISSGEKKAKKRNRDSDLLEPLRDKNDEKDSLPKSLEFNEITKIEELLPVTVTVNRAPIKTAWTYVVARRLGFDVQEALSIAHVYVHFSSLKHALMLGNILNPQETREAEEEISELPGWSKENDHKSGESSRASGARKGKGRMWGNAREGEKGMSSQPWVDILRAKIPVIERTDGTWRAIEKGVSVEPSVAYLYITKALKQYAPHVLGAMQIVASSYEPEELNRIGMSLYNEFKPDVVEWGQRGTLDCAKILDTAKGPVDAPETTTAAAAAGETEKPLGAGANATKPVESGESSATGPSSLQPPEKAAPDPAEVADGSESDLSEVPDLNDGPSSAKKAKVETSQAANQSAGGMSWEEYEAMLEKEDEAGGFMEGVDLYDVQ